MKLYQFRIQLLNPQQLNLQLQNLQLLNIQQLQKFQPKLHHRPKTGRISLEVSDGLEKIVNSGNITDYGLSDGRVGVFTCSQEKAFWSELSYVFLSH